jgi:hypothetical protein
MVQLKRLSRGGQFQEADLKVNANDNEVNLNTIDAFRYLDLHLYNSLRSIKPFFNSPHLIFLLRRLVILMAFRYNALLLFHHRQPFLDNVVQLLRHAVFDVVFIVYNFTGDFLLKVAYLVDDEAILKTTVMSKDE